MAIVKTQALILNKKLYSNTSLIISALTSSGQINLIAKGARDIQKTYRNGKINPIDKCTFATLVYYEATTGLYPLSECFIHYDFPGIRSNLDAWLVSANILDLLLTTTFPNVESVDILTLAIYCLSNLDNLVNPKTILIFFLYYYLHANGVLPDFFHCNRSSNSLLDCDKILWSPINNIAYSDKSFPLTEILDTYTKADWRIFHKIISSKGSLEYIKIENPNILDSILGLLKECVFNDLGFKPKSF